MSGRDKRKVQDLSLSSWGNKEDPAKETKKGSPLKSGIIKKTMFQRPRNRPPWLILLVT